MLDEFDFDCLKLCVLNLEFLNLQKRNAKVQNDSKEEAKDKSLMSPKEIVLLKFDFSQSKNYFLPLCFICV